MKGYDEYLKMIRNHFIKIMMEEQKDKFRIEAVKQVHLGKAQNPDDFLGLKLFVMKTLDKCVKVRRSVYRRMLHEKFGIRNFREEDRV